MQRDNIILFYLNMEQIPVLQILQCPPKVKYYLSEVLI